MKWLHVLGILVTVTLMTLYEWPRIHGRKERITYAVLMLIGLQLSVLLLYIPELPGPVQLIDTVYRPLGRLLEK
ncbi:hypothetical protein PM3016_6242 [Paenibacillus mucilaginosus 3016]|uniref:Uncharacterized protein n=1 Tax=Paenibacillus mucilaginosus 3016 TaxID=1116391 RepID=H6NBD2_9BACL|nr:hypothetical protein PM3016_6242 [Paenibacillus mucilaginosus 3016]WFA21330.1 hypothetical protein ERY13_31010 [Paenibacillus mucilaginosus]